MLESILFLPLICGLITFLLPVRIGRYVLVFTGCAHLILTCIVWLGDHYSQDTWGFFAVTPVGMLVLLVTSFIFLFISFYAVFYMREQAMRSEHTFICCMLLFLSTMSMATLADHLIVLWIAIEATTLTSAPLIFINRSRKALEATWKYVLICSVGIALSLLGFFFIALSMDRAGLDVPLTFASLNELAGLLDPLWLKTGFIFVLIGLGTKAGLAPMHTWLPDAHSEAPSPASALLSGALLNCALLGIYKTHCLMQLAGGELGQFSSFMLMGFGLFSILMAGIFILNQQDYKRMLAYSSIENMGIIVFGIGVGGLGLYGAMLHLMHHSLIKSSLFLSAGNLVLAFGSKLISASGNMVRLLPRTFVTFFGGFIALSGLPPFGIFLSEMLILLGAWYSGHFLAASLFVVCLILVVAGFTRNMIALSFAPNSNKVLIHEQLPRIVPSAILLSASILLCIWMPDALYQTIIQAIALIGGKVHG